jgi:uncharacterized protein YceK
MRFSLLMLLASTLMVAQLSGCATVQSHQAASHEATDHDARLNGSWQGKVALAGNTEQAMEFRLDINDQKGTVWVGTKGTWREAKPGAFHLDTLKSNAMLFATDAGHDDEGSWVESWVFVTTLLDNDELLVEWTRVANNMDKPKSAVDGKFAVHGSGTLQRVH